MTAVWRPHEGCMKAAQPLPIGRMLDHRFRLNTHPTHNVLTLASHWSYGIIMKPHEGRRRNLWIFSAPVRWGTYSHCIHEANFMWTHLRMGLSCSQCAAVLRDMRKTIINELHADHGHM